MNTRSFFKSLAMMTAGAVISPGLFIPKFEPVKWKVTRITRRVVANPAYASAMYEIGFDFHPGAPLPEGMVLENGIVNMPLWMYPVRGNEMDSNGQLISIPPFIIA